MHGIMGRAWCYDRCIHLPLMMTSTCNNNYKHNTLYVLSVQATVQLHEQVNDILKICTDML